MFASTEPPITCTVCTGAFRSLAPIVKKPATPDSVLMNRRGSCSQLPPTFRLCSRPPNRRAVQLTSTASPEALWALMDADWIGVKRREKSFDLK